MSSANSKHPSGLGNRFEYAGDPTGGGSKYSTATPNFAGENMGDSFMARPTTAFLRMFDKFSSISSFGGSNGGSSNLTSTLNSGNKDKKQHSILALHLQSKLGKMSKLEQKLMSLQLELANDLVDWAGNIPNPESEYMVKKFSNLLLVQKEANATVNDKLEKLKLSLAFVNEREKKQLDLIAVKCKILKQLRDCEVKYGPSASSTTLLKEKLEENVCNLGVVEIQYIRSITKNLKEALIDYLYALQSVASNYSDATNDYYEVLLSLESNSDLAHNSPKKVGNQPVGLAQHKKELNPSNGYFAEFSKSANDIESNQPKIDPHKFTSSESPIKMTPHVLEDHKNYSLCAECLKENKLGHRLITPCTHNNSRNSNMDAKQGVHHSPTRITQDNISVQGFDIKDTYQPSEQWG